MAFDLDDQKLYEFETRRLAAMDKERSSFIAHYRELGEFTQPRRGQFEGNLRNRGEKRHRSIINSRATRALRIARAGMVAGVMSPTRPWFVFEPEDEALLRFPGVREWFFDAARVTRNIFLSSGLYEAIPITFENMLLFGTGAISHLSDPVTIARFVNHPTGSYYIAQNEKMQINTFARTMEMTTDQMVKEFGLARVSREVKNAWDRGNRDAWFGVVNIIDENPDVDPRKLTIEFKPFRSLYYEPKGERKFLAARGFDEFPVYVPRWDRTGEDIYATNCPGMEVLGDIKSMQIMERRKAQAVDKMVRPPLAGPSSLRNTPIEDLAGGSTLYDGEQQNQLRSLYQINPAIAELRLDIQAIEQRINEGFFVDLFMAISAMPGIQPKNQLELLQRNEERLLQLGPALRNVNNDLLRPLVIRAFQQAARAGRIAQPPRALEAQPIKIRFVSSLALAQRVDEIQSIERVSIFVGQMAGIVGESAIDKFNADEAIDKFSQLVGADPDIVRNTEAANAIREARAQAQQQALAAQQAEQQARALQSAGSGIQQLASASAQTPEATANEPGA